MTAPKVVWPSRLRNAASTPRWALRSISQAVSGAPAVYRETATLFSESASRVVVSVAPAQLAALLRVGVGQGPACKADRSCRWESDSSLGGWEAGCQRTGERGRANLGYGDRVMVRAAPGHCLTSYTVNSDESPLMFDKFRDECGVFGIFGHPEASEPRLPRPLRAPASRSGERWHRCLRRAARARVPGDGVCERGVRHGVAREASGSHGRRSRPLLDGGREPSRQRPTDSRG